MPKTHAFKYLNKNLFKNNPILFAITLEDLKSVAKNQLNRTLTEQDIRLFSSAMGQIMPGGQAMATMVSSIMDGVLKSIILKENQSSKH